MSSILKSYSVMFYISVSDTKMKFFELSSNIFCTMSGRVSVLDNMFLDVQQKVKKGNTKEYSIATVNCRLKMTKSLFPILQIKNEERLGMHLQQFIMHQKG